MFYVPVHVEQTLVCSQHSWRLEERWTRRTQRSEITEGTGAGLFQRLLQPMRSGSLVRTMQELLGGGRGAEEEE